MKREEHWFICVVGDNAGFWDMKTKSRDLGGQWWENKVALISLFVLKRKSKVLSVAVLTTLFLIIADVILIISFYTSPIGN